MMVKTLLFICSLYPFFLKEMSAQDLPSMTISFPNDAPMYSSREFLKLVYSKIGVNANFVSYPAKRALKELEMGKIDGDMFRLSVAEIPNKIVKVDVPLGEIKFFLVSKTDQNKKHDLKEIKKDTKIGILLGYVAAEKLASSSNKVFSASTQKQLFDLLDFGRVEYIITPGLVEDSKLQYNQTVIFRGNVYHLLSAKHKDLIPKLGKVFQENLSQEFKEKIQKEIDPNW